MTARREKAGGDTWLQSASYSRSQSGMPKLAVPSDHLGLKHEKTTCSDWALQEARVHTLLSRRSLDQANPWLPWDCRASYRKVWATNVLSVLNRGCCCCLYQEPCAKANGVSGMPQGACMVFIVSHLGRKKRLYPALLIFNTDLK